MIIIQENDLQMFSVKFESNYYYSEMFSVKWWSLSLSLNVLTYWG